jgi:hypothetical protein
LEDLADEIFTSEIFIIIFEILSLIASKTAFRIKVTHTAILDFIMEEFKITPSKMQGFFEILDQTNDILNKTEIIKQKIKNLDLDQQGIEKFLNTISIRDSTTLGVKDKLKKITTQIPPYVEKALGSLELLRVTISNLLGSKFPELNYPIDVCTVAKSDDLLFHSGLTFQIVSETTLVTKTKKFSQIHEEKIIEGGR